MIELPSRSRPNVNADINIVPYIDVMLVLLVIFMMTTPIIEQGVEVDLPQAEASMVEYTKNQPTVITIDRKGDYYINSLEDATAEITEEGEKVSINVAVNRVIARLQIWPEMKVFVRGDRNVDYGSVVELMAVLGQNGVEKVGIITETEN
ncbi:MAG: protein TolR [Gammaproteobacteria bacterium]|jgi:biopolymer transport protein TolR|nr:protein TolR [Gammaproteobacteria bacterium]MDP6973560.1 protein TolR [Gammaproteobacteria bacterium]